MHKKDENLLKKAEEASKNSNNKNVKIGAAVEDDNERIHTGCIIETQDKHQSVHAERIAVLKALSEGAKYIKKIGVYINKSDLRICGCCLHILYEFAEGNGDIKIIKKGNDGVKENSLKKLYPEPWPPIKTEK